MNDTAIAEETSAPAADDGWEWCFLEVMGHRSHWGRSREVEKFGTKMIRIDVPIDGDPIVKGWKTHHYGGPAIFCHTPTDEATVMRENKPYERPSRLRLEYHEPHHVDDDEPF